MPIDVAACRYQAMIGTGGIGSGVFFALDGNQTLGREESRSGHFLERKDYSKLHIISHYVRALLGPGFPVIPVGKVGADDVGDSLLAEMGAAGLDLRYVERAAGRQTLYSVCFMYPDGSGGNLTTNDSACSHVDPTFVVQAEAEFERFAGRGVALAVPEVPLPARLKLLELGGQHSFLRVASFTPVEMAAVAGSGALASVDVLALNVDEAAAAAGISGEPLEPAAVVEAVLETIGQRDHPRLLSITAGSRGSWSWDGETLVHIPAFPVPVESTAGAGDAHLAGIIAGLVAGLPLGRAQELGALSAALSVTSPHTINKAIGPGSLHAFVVAARLPVSGDVLKLLEVLS